MDERFSRQSFLGEDAERIYATVKLGIVGDGGGGSHVVQQVAHIGLAHPAVADHDKASGSNANRLVGSTARDILAERLKAQIARRVIKSINPRARPLLIGRKWQEAQTQLRDSAALIGCVDSIGERAQLECFARRFLIPYIDIGMDVHHVEAENRYVITGQIVLSSPGAPCLRCMGIITDEKLAEEARRYGDAGARPQVVWPNGVLASTAVGIFAQLVTPWHPDHPETIYLEYDGNANTLQPSPRLPFLLAMRCTHFAAHEVGDPYFFLRRPERRARGSKPHKSGPME